MNVFEGEVLQVGGGIADSDRQQPSAVFGSDVEPPGSVFAVIETSEVLGGWWPSSQAVMRLYHASDGDRHRGYNGSIYRWTWARKGGEGEGPSRMVPAVIMFLFRLQTNEDPLRVGDRVVGRVLTG